MTASSCYVCGELSDGPRCDDHKPRIRSKFRSNPTRWKNLSKRLRRQQPWCNDCGATSDLTVDHIVPYIERPDLAYDIRNLTVLCRSCNSTKSTRGVAPPDTESPAGPRPNLDFSRRQDTFRGAYGRDGA